jgi:hypothetical protein
MILGDLKQILIIFFSEFNRPGYPIADVENWTTHRWDFERGGHYDFGVLFSSNYVPEVLSYELIFQSSTHEPFLLAIKK